MPGTVTPLADVLRVIWIAMIGVYTVLVLDGMISGLATMVYVLCTIAVMVTETLLRRRSAA